MTISQGAGRKLDRAGKAEEESAFDIRQVRPEAAPLQLNPVPAAQEDSHPDHRSQSLRHQGRKRRPGHAEARHRSPAENEQRIEHEIQEDRAEHDIERDFRLTNAAHQRLEHGVDENKNNADERHPHETERAGIDIGFNAEKDQQIRRQDIAERTKNNRAEGDHQHGLGSDMIDHVLPARAHIMRRQRRAGHGKSGPKRDHQECDRKTDRHRGDRRRAQPSYPKGVGELVAGLQDVAQDDRNREPYQRAIDRTFQQHLTAIVGHCSSCDPARVIKCAGL